MQRVRESNPVGESLAMANMSTAEVNAYLAKQFADQRKDAVSTGVPVECESLLHNQIICECKRRQWIYFHSRMDRPTGSTIGQPDFILLLPNGRTLLIECKSKTGKLSSEQLGMIIWAKKLGHTIHVICSMEEFYEITLKTQNHNEPENKN